MSECRHGESLWGRCVKCGMTWEEQAKVGKVAEFRFEVGQRVVSDESKRHATVTYRCNNEIGAPVYMIRWDQCKYEVLRGEPALSPAPLRHGETVERDQADSIPAGTVVRDGYGVLARRNSFGSYNLFCTKSPVFARDLKWPVTVEIPAGDDE